MSTQTTEGDNEQEFAPRVFGFLLFGASLAAIGSYDFVGAGEGAIVFGVFIGGLGELVAGFGRRTSATTTSGPS